MTRTRDTGAVRRGGGRGASGRGHARRVAATGAFAVATVVAGGAFAHPPSGCPSTTVVVQQQQPCAAGPAIDEVPEYGQVPDGYGPPPPAGYGTSRAAGPRIEGGDRVEMERFSTGLMVTGIVAMPIGLLAGAAGAFMAFSDSGSCHDDGDGWCYEYQLDADDSFHRDGDDDAQRRTGVALMVGGGLVLTTGIVLTAIGARKVAVVKGDAASLTPTVTVGASGADLSWSF